MATFILDPDEAGEKLKKQVIAYLIPKLPVRIVEPIRQVDQITGQELQQLLKSKTLS